MADTKTKTTDYPEHEKMKAIVEESNAIGAFLDNTDYVLCKVRPEGDNGEPRYVWGEGHEIHRAPTQQDFLRGRAEYNPAFDSWRSGFVPVGQPITQILADYFGIDLDKIEAEKREMLDKLREMNA